MREIATVAFVGLILLLFRLDREGRARVSAALWLPVAWTFLAGSRMVDVETAARALEIAAQASAAPGPNGVPIRQPIEVRQVMGAPDPEV